MKGNEEKQIRKKLLSTFVVLTMVFATMTILLTSTDPVNAYDPCSDCGCDDEGATLRVYGEEDAAYPTQSYTEERDFVYLNHIDPFDPGVLSKDSVTFNPAIFGMDYNGEQIKVNGMNSREKVFLRLFYEPDYYHPQDALMRNFYPYGLKPVNEQHGGGFDAVVLETTYFLITADNQPVAGFSDPTTYFVLPYASNDPDIPGMDFAGCVDLKRVICNDDFSKLDERDGAGEIWVEKSFYGLKSGDSASFMDHTMTFEFYDDEDQSDKAMCTIKYDGNMYGEHEFPVTHDDLREGERYFFDRNNDKQKHTDPAHRWYMEITRMVGGSEDVTNNIINVEVGRVLVGGETFYVDGVRYDMPAIYTESCEDVPKASIGDGDCDECNDCAFKYITFQTPLPKCDDEMWFDDITDNVYDWSHVSSQWLANLLPGDDAYVLPPFNEAHNMIDDIGLIKNDTHWDDKDDCCPYSPDWEVPASGLILNDEVGELLFHYVEEDYEERFNTSLAEILYNHADECCDFDLSGDCCDWDEEWTWLNVYTKPIRYTEFCFPDQEKPGDEYDPDDPDLMKWYEEHDYKYPFTTADGNEYLLTSSFIAPNSCAYTDRCTLSKNDYTNHEIIDRVFDAITKYYGFGQREEYSYYPRVAFEFDAFDCTDFYINEVDNDVSVRIYGEEDFFYPTHSWSQSNNPGLWGQFVNNIFDWGHIGGDFIYPHYVFPFYPGVIPKDSITFNPAIFDMEYNGEQIKVNGINSREKVFLRAFYEPDFYHDIDMKMYQDGLKPVNEQHGGGFDAVVLETTYFLITADNEPVAGEPDKTTKFILPYKSDDSDIPGMDTAGLVTLSYADAGPDFPIKENVVENCFNLPVALTDGNIGVEKQYYGLKKGDSVSFMDHTVEFLFYDDEDNSDKAVLTVTYDGNMYGEHEFPVTHDDIREDQTYWFDRNNEKQHHTDPAHRWYLEVTMMAGGHEDPDNNMINIIVGRALNAGETFYVNGVRYDMPAIYVEGDCDDRDEKDGCHDCCDYAFKYITFQTPLPKCDDEMWFDDVTDNVYDWSHVSSQWLANLLPGDDVWVLPPFNEEHNMIDDIGLLKNDTDWEDKDVCCNKYEPDWEIPASGLMLEDPVGELKFQYISESYEPRFNTSLAERLCLCNDQPTPTIGGGYCELCEYWSWWNVYTQPVNYTEFVLPDQEKPGDEYDSDDPDLEKWYDENGYEYPYTTADGNEYLITSSWIAPNSEESDICSQSKYSYEAHDILSILHFAMEELDSPRFAFEFDAVDGTGIYINSGCDVTGDDDDDDDDDIPDDDDDDDTCVWNVDGVNGVNVLDLIAVANHLGDIGGPYDICGPDHGESGSMVTILDLICVAQHIGDC